MLKIERLSKSFASKSVLDDISLHIRSGEIISILGRSGSGKSTLLNLIAGFERAEIGTITLENRIISSEEFFVDPSKRSIGFVFQNYALFPHLTVSENIAFGIAQLSKDERSDRVDKLLSLINLEGYGSKYPDTLSGGEQQRIALARVLATEPSVVLLDEPFSNVDTVLKTTIRDELTHILRSSGTTAILVTHDPYEAMAISDRIAYIDNGKIVQYDTPEALYSTPVNENVAAFFGPINRLCGKFVRVENCFINETGSIHAHIESSVFMGARYETRVHFVLNNESCSWLIYTDRRYERGEKVAVSI